VVQGGQAITYRYSCFVRNAFQSPHGTPGVVATPPDQHDAIWAVQKALDFPRHVFGVERPPEGQTIMPEVMPRYARALVRRHESDRELGGTSVPDAKG
jgi:hypothetical protein